MRDLLFDCFESGPGVFAHGTQGGDRLAAMRDAFKAFDEACEAFTTEGSLNRSLLQEAEDHLTAVSSMLKVLLVAAPRIREINDRFSSDAAAAQACLGVLWHKGEPCVEALTKSREWGEALHSRLLALAGEDFGWFGSFRQLLSGLFTEGPSVYAPETVIGGRMTRFRDHWSVFNQTLVRYVQEVRLRREVLDKATDHLAAAIALTDRITAAWPKIREWCSWQKARHEAITLGLLPIVEKLESAEGSAVGVPGLFERSFRRELLFAIIENEQVIREFFGTEHNERIERFRELDGQLAKLSRDMIRVRLTVGIPQNSQFTVTSTPSGGGNGSILGVDVSQHNGTIDWTSLAAQGVRFAWARSTLGVGINDSRYNSNASAAVSAGIVFGAYHFAYPVYTGGSNTAVAEAQWFVSRAGSQIGAGFLPPALDIENDGGENPVISSLSTQALTDWILAWCGEVLRLTGVRPIVYMNSSFASSEVDSRIGVEFPLWLANYGTNSGILNLSLNPATGTWPNWQVWQFTSRGVMAGNGSTYIDRNVFSGDEASFQAFINGMDTSVTNPTDAMYSLNRTVPKIMTNIGTPNATTSHYEARIMVRRIMENFVNRPLTSAELLTISSAVPFDDPTVKPEPVSRQEVFKMLVGSIEGVKGYSRPAATAPGFPDIPASGWERDAILDAFAWEIADSSDANANMIQPTFSVPRHRFAKWAVQMMDVLLNPPVNNATADMLALNGTVPAVMVDMANPRRYTSHYEARLMVKKTLEVALGRTLTTAELLTISSASPFDDASIGTQPVARREVFQMILSGLESVAMRTRPTATGITLEDMPASGWQANAIAGSNAWGVFDSLDTPSSEIYESARVSRYSFAKWDRKILTLLGTAASGTFNQWVTDAGLSGADTAGTADPDHDGLNNAVEMVLGGNPATGMNAAFAPTVERIVNPAGTVPAGDYLLFSYRRTDSSVTSGVMSGVLYDTDMAGAWTQAVHGVNGVRIVESNDNFGAGVDRVQIYIPRSSNQKIFARLKVVVP